MPTPKPYWAENILEVACGFCEAKVGEKCRTKAPGDSWVFASRPHERRVTAARWRAERQA